MEPNKWAVLVTLTPPHHLATPTHLIDATLKTSGVEISATVLETKRCVAPAEKHAVLRPHVVSVCWGQIQVKSSKSIGGIQSLKTDCTISTSDQRVEI